MKLSLTLIKANIALYRGERAEALRLLRQYQSERPAGDDPHRSMVLWLEAQTQPDDAMRARLLRDLIHSTDIDDTYAQMAREYLLAEEAYSAPPQPKRRTGLWLGGALGGVLLVGAGLLLRPFANDPTPTATPALTPTPAAALAETLPDRSEPLVADGFTARYERGILQVVALEDRSERVVSADGAVLEPVAGARFYALEIVFECRGGICDAPPEAALALQTGTDMIAAREDVTIAGDGVLEPIALGRSTRGWVVFEVPSLSNVEALHVQPEDADPIIIDLPE
jgi:hypothetical protein